MTRYLLKSEEHERTRNSIPWDLTFYDDETGNIETILEFQIVEED